MREARMYSFSTRVFQRARDLRQRPAGVAHVVNYQTIAATNIADNVHDFGYVSLFTTLITKCEFGIEPLRVSSSALSAARVRSHYRQVRQRMFLIVADKNRCSIQVVHRNIKEALDLRSVQV